MGPGQEWQCQNVTRCKFVCSMHSEAKQTEKLEFGAEKGLLQGHVRRWAARAQKTQNFSKGFCKGSLKARWGRGVVSCCKLLGVGILCSCSCPHRSGHDAPVNLQQDTCHFLFCNFFSLNEWKSVKPLKVRALRMDYPLHCLFQAIGNILLQKVQSQHD